MGNLGALLKHPEEIYPLLKFKMAIKNAKKQIPKKPHWAFCYTILHKVAGSSAFIIQHLHSELRDSILILYLVLRALDTIGGTDDCKVLMEHFHHVQVAFLDLKKSHQDVIKDTTKKRWEQEWQNLSIETIEDLIEYAHHVAGLVGIRLSRLFYASGLEDLAPDSLSNSTGLLLQIQVSFRFCAIPQVKAVGILALCYNNTDVFRVSLKLRRGLIAKLFHQIRTMSDVYDCLLEFTSIIKAKVEMHDPNASTTLNRLDAIQKICRESKPLNHSGRKYYAMSKEQGYHSVWVR
ncbi:hypothetical protein L6164_033481 [Bauhinia variegata]|uniref:Uncharacterized protein n=1 Tax=Bauhinia variegata TaxID=167791 RepID=A0ACB9KRT0_BAUVA|nr:hypothetical protein L6164_033481 [Bauhinia variegata]